MYLENIMSLIFQYPLLALALTTKTSMLGMEHFYVLKFVTTSNSCGSVRYSPHAVINMHKQTKDSNHNLKVYLPFILHVSS